MSLLRSFVAIADTGGFSSAAERVARTQSAVSLQMQRLEQQAGRALFARAGRARRLTEDGERLLVYARRMLSLNDAALTELSGPALEGRVRLGTPEDFATVHLPGVLAKFSARNPRVALEVECDFTVYLLRAFREGKFDLALVKRAPTGSEAGERVWREPLVWAAAPQFAVEDAVPLVLAPEPDVYRRRALAALDEAGLSHRIVYSSPSLAGLQAAAKAGMGVTVLPLAMVPSGLKVVARGVLPPLEDAEIALLKRERLPRAAESLAEAIITHLEEERAAA